MPLFYQHTINEGTKLGIWLIEETESFFLEKVPEKKEVTHPHKRLQHLAGRFLLPVLFEDFPLEEIVIADTRRPFLENEKYHFSISHCGPYAAAIVSTTSRVGVDIEMVSPKIALIRQKFLSPAEFELAAGRIALADNPQDQYLELLTLLWSAKESVFKWHGLGKLDFKNNMRLSGYPRLNVSGWIELPFIFEKKETIGLVVKGKKKEPLMLTWVMS
jgi:phosphopantetheinyl transferase